MRHHIIIFPLVCAGVDHVLPAWWQDVPAHAALAWSEHVQALALLWRRAQSSAGQPLQRADELADFALVLEDDALHEALTAVSLEYAALHGVPIRDAGPSVAQSEGEATVAAPLEDVAPAELRLVAQDDMAVVWRQLLGRQDVLVLARY